MKAWILVLVSTAAFADHYERSLELETAVLDRRVGTTCKDGLQRTQAGELDGIQVDIIHDCDMSDGFTHLAIKTKAGWIATHGVPAHEASSNHTVTPSVMNVAAETVEMIAPTLMLHRVITVTKFSCQDCAKFPAPPDQRQLAYEVCRIGKDVRCLPITTGVCKNNTCDDITYKAGVIHVGKDEIQLQ
ncbi:MAG: hypothetical protein QM831_25870 [Kofleriaceae bacterium]